MLSRIANNHGVSPQQVALARLLQRSPVILPIPGASKSRNVIDCAHLVKVTLTLKKISHEIGKTPAQVALNWVIHRLAVSSAIVGASRTDQLEGNVGAVG